ncbi:uncharacterized protein LOC142487969 isoform X1 [Ascaphus truei]|uniref:uncharacterized protein LOC142487969 isoform X1 n=3 Tax=Ascaphus truei TaxID=8439 RepID=UPI003F5947F6
MSRTLPVQMHLTFNDVAVYFSEAEWKDLEGWQKDLYKEVMTDNYDNLISLGMEIPKPDILVKLECGEEPCIPDAGEPMLLCVGSTNENQTSPEPEPLIKQHHDQVLDTNKRKVEDSLAFCFRCGSNYPCHCKSGMRSFKKPYSCVDCGKSYSRELFLLLHQKSHLRGEAYKCSSCEKSFRKPFHLRKHQKTHEEGQEYKCTKCEEHFINKSLLTKHKKIHRRERKYNCKKCGEVLRTKLELTTHQNMHKKIYQCTDCPKAFRNKSEYMSHQRGHTGDLIYECKECGKIYTRRSSFVKHLSSHSSQLLTNNTSHIYKPKYGKAQGILNQEKVDWRYKNLQIVEDNEESPKENVVWKGHGFVTCPSGKASWGVQHETDTSKPASTSEGSIQRVVNRSQLVNHQRTQNPDTECSVKKIFTYCSPTSLYQTDDAQEKKPKYVKSKERLLLLSEHKLDPKTRAAEKAFKCMKCNKRYRHCTSFTRHQKTHTQTFVCHECGQAFRKLLVLFMHRHVHGGKKLYRCGECKKGFSFKSLLHLHQKTHGTQEEPNQGRGCGHESSQPFNLCHDSPIYKCSLCHQSFGKFSALIFHQETHKVKYSKMYTNKRSHKAEYLLLEV